MTSPAPNEYTQTAARLTAQCAVRWEVITPEIAAELLALNTDNRRPKDKRQAQITRDILERAFVPNGETIIVGKTRLLDGQNRLMACAAAGVPIVSLVVREMDDDAFASLDQGTPRSIVDRLQKDGVPNATMVAAATSVVWRFGTGRAESAKGWMTGPTVAEAMDTIGRHPLILTATRSLGLTAQRAGLPAGGICGMYVRCCEIDALTADDFFGRLTTGADLGADEPVYLLRSRLLKERAAGRLIPASGLCTLIAKAWNATRESRTVGTLKGRRRLNIPRDGRPSLRTGYTERFPSLV